MADTKEAFIKLYCKESNTKEKDLLKTKVVILHNRNSIAAATLIINTDSFTIESNSELLISQY